MFYALAQLICDAVDGEVKCRNHFPPDGGVDLAICTRRDLLRASRKSGWKRVAGTATSDAMDLCPACNERITRQASALRKHYIAQQKGGE